MIPRQRLVSIIAELEMQLGFHELENNCPAMNSLQYIKDLLDELLRRESLCSCTKEEQKMKQTRKQVQCPVCKYVQFIEVSHDVWEIFIAEDSVIPECVDDGIRYFRCIGCGHECYEEEILKVQAEDAPSFSSSYSTNERRCV